MIECEMLCYLVLLYIFCPTLFWLIINFTLFLVVSDVAFLNFAYFLPLADLRFFLYSLLDHKKSVKSVNFCPTCISDVITRWLDVWLIFSLWFYFNLNKVLCCSFNCPCVIKFICRIYRKIACIFFILSCYFWMIEFLYLLFIPD